MSTPALQTPDSRGADVPPEHRGQLQVSDTAVEHIAEAAAAEISSVMDGRGRGASARADVDGRVARIRIGVILRYPVAVPRACDQIRNRVIARLRDYAGISVARCDIQVTELQAPRPQRRVQ